MLSVSATRASSIRGRLATRTGAAGARRGRGVQLDDRRDDFPAGRPFPLPVRREVWHAQADGEQRVRTRNVSPFQLLHEHGIGEHAGQAGAVGGGERHFPFPAAVGARPGAENARVAGLDELQRPPLLQGQGGQELRRHVVFVVVEDGTAAADQRPNLPQGCGADEPPRTGQNGAVLAIGAEVGARVGKRDRQYVAQRRLPPVNEARRALHASVVQIRDRPDPRTVRRHNARDTARAVLAGVGQADDFSWKSQIAPALPAIIAEKQANSRLGSPLWLATLCLSNRATMPERAAAREVDCSDIALSMDTLEWEAPAFCRTAFREYNNQLRLMSSGRDRGR